MELATSTTTSLLRQSPPPLLTAFLDRLVLLSPRTWFGIIELNSKNHLSQLDATTLAQAVIGAILPILLLIILDQFSTKRLASTMLPLVTLLSPWTIQSTMTTLIQLQHLFKSLWGYKQGRSKLLESATETLQNRVQSQRAYQTRRYNVFLPHNHTNNTKAILLIPGALISHTAYSEVASRLSDQGFVVLVVSMEPFRLAYRHLGADVRSMSRMMSQIERQLLLLRGESGCSTLEWTLMGHSMGAFAAMHLFHQFQKQQSSSPIRRPSIDKLVMWGVAAFVTMATDLSIYNKDDTRILLVQATEDTLLPMTQQWQADMDANFPTQQTRKEWILGGTHHGFASYASPHSKTTPNECISYQDQQEQACQLTSNFLFENADNNKS